MVLSEEAIFQYKCDNLYSPSYEAAIAWDDPELGIDWCVSPQSICLSSKDLSHPLLKDYEELFNYHEDLYSV